jgi:PGF-pre-PGF domain-containing protein
VLRAEWDLEEKEEHVYSRKGLPDGATVSFTVPEGWEIKSVEDLKGASISSDNRTVRGLAIVDKSHVIVFRRILPVVPFTPPPSITPTLVTPTPTPTLPPSPVTPAVTPVPPKEVDISTIHPSVSPGEIKQFQFTRSDIREIRAKLLTHSFHIGFRVEKIEFLQGIPEAGDFVYAYTNITPVRIVDGQLLPVDLKIEESWVDFRVGKEWIQKNGIDEERIKLARYEEKGRKWEYFHASILRKEKEYIYYSAKIPGFSLLAITGDKILPAPPFDPKLGIALSAIFISVSILIFIFYRREKPVDLDLLRERARNIRALLESIDEQYSQRKISEKTYRELRRKNEKELAKVKRKMRRALR